jgi:hypothetical protein
MYLQCEAKTAATKDAGRVLGYLHVSVRLAPPGSVSHGRSANALSFELTHYLVSAIGSLYLEGRRGFLSFLRDKNL